MTTTSKKLLRRIGIWLVAIAPLCFIAAFAVGVYEWGDAPDSVLLSVLLHAIWWFLGIGLLALFLSLDSGGN